MPAEWEPHAATWLSWPRREGISFPRSYDHVLPTFREMVAALLTSEPVCINVSNGAHEAETRAVLDGLPQENLTFYTIPTNEPWCRDHGPIFLTRNDEPRLAVIDWGHNAWGGKYPPFDLDDAVPTRVAETLGLPVYDGGIILEGGAIDVNGQGALLTTEACLLNPNRNPDLDRSAIEEYLRNYLGVRKILWLGDGIAGDDTDGHVDDLTRFVDPTTVVTVVEDDPADENYEPLQENLERLRGMTDQGGQPLRVVPLPMPRPLYHDGQRLPASYANFYIANGLVLLPTYDPERDPVAQATLQELFPDREVIGIDCTDLVWGLGAFHCVTQQWPAIQVRER